MLRNKLKAMRKHSMFPHSVTVYNVRIESDSSFNDVIGNHITILRGVLLDSVKAVNVRASGLESADAVTLYVPFDVEAIDGVTGEPKKYVKPAEWKRASDKTGLWTMTLDGQGGDSFFIKGEVVEPDLSLERLSLLYDDVYKITKVDAKDFGGSMAHWEVGGA